MPGRKQHALQCANLATLENLDTTVRDNSVASCVVGALQQQHVYHAHETSEHAHLLPINKQLSPLRHRMLWVQHCILNVCIKLLYTQQNTN